MKAARFVADNSVVMAWCFEDETSDYSAAVLELLEAGEVLVPAVWPLEVGNVLLVAERTGRLGHAGLVRFVELLEELPITVEQEPPGRMLKEILSLARDLKLTTYDASYLDLAMRSGLPIATQDKTLIRAAKKCAVDVITVKAQGA